MTPHWGRVLIVSLVASATNFAPAWLIGIGVRDFAVFMAFAAIYVFVVVGALRCSLSSVLVSIPANFFALWAASLLHLLRTETAEHTTLSYLLLSLVSICNPFMGPTILMVIGLGVLSGLISRKLEKIVLES